MNFLYTLLWSFTPLLELRASIPLGYWQFGLSIYEAVGISILGGILTTIVVLWGLPIGEKIAERLIPPLHKILEKIYAKTRAKHSEKIERLGAAFLVIFVAIPLPGSGAWSGSLIAYLFGVPRKKALILIGLGVCLSGVIVGLLTISGTELWDWISSR
jgi:uncharacterized membrane protein